MHRVYICLLFYLCSCILQTALSYDVYSRGLFSHRYLSTSTTSRIGHRGTLSARLQNAVSSSPTALAAGGRPSRERGPPKKKQKDDVISCTGTVIESLPNAMFRVEIEGASGQVVLATISGKIRKNFVRIVVGDSVMVDLSAYDLTRGRITYRNK